MNMPVVNIRVMWVRVLNGKVCVAVNMFAAFTLYRIMRVLVVLIVLVFVLVLQNFMQVLMDMVLSEVQPYTHTHQRRSNPECQRRRFRENKQSNCRPNEWRS